VFSKLLVPVDGSEPSSAAVRLAVDVARRYGGEIVLCHVLDIASIVALSGSMTMDPSIAVEAQRSLGEELLKATAAEVGAKGVPVSAEFLEGEVVAQILDLARAKGVDAIVMGSHGRSGIARALLGSKTEGVLRRSPIPVLVAPAAIPGPPAGPEVK